MNFFICYDITSDPLRLKVSKWLEREGCVRVQKSVFLAVDFGPAEALRLERGVAVRFRGKGDPGDSVMYIPIDRDHLGEVIWQGDAEKWAGLFEKVYGRLY